MLKSGHRPVRSFYLGFGHDEEVMNAKCQHFNVYIDIIFFSRHF